MSAQHAASTPSTRVRAWVAQIGLLAAALLLLPSWAPSASAATGTVKIDNEIPQNNNNPHQGCGIIVELYDWSPAGPASVYVVFTGQGGAGAGVVAGSSPASGPGNPILFTAGSGGPGSPDGSQLYEIDTTGLTPQAGGQFHIDVDTYDTATGAVIGKQKVIWVETCNSDLEVTKAGPATYVPGGTGNYTIDVTNNGPNRAPGPITVVDTLPAGETATSATGTGWVCDLSVPTEVTCTYAADLARGEDAPRITVGISYGAGATGDLTDTATVSSRRVDLDPSNDSSSVTTRPLPTVDVGLTKTATPAGVAPGANVTYIVTVTNHGTAPVTAFSVSDPLGTGLSPVSVSTTSPGLTCLVGPPVSCAFAGSLAGGASATATVVARVGAAYTGQSVTNAASVSMPLDSDPTNNSDSVTTRVVHPVDLAVVKTVTSPAPPAAVAPGDSITYSLAVTNAGNGPVSAFTLSDPVPATHALVSVTENDPRLACTNAVSCTFAGAGDALDPGETVTVTVVMTVLSSVTATSVSNTATVPADSNNANNSSTATTAVTQPKDVALTKAHAPAGPFAPGDTVTYTVTATNDGVLPITAFTISDPLATGLTWVSTTGGPGLSCAASAPVSCTYAGTLTTGQSVVATVVATVTPSFTGTSVLNVATATMAGDTDNSNDSASDVIDITQPRDVALTKTASPLTAKPGDTVTYTLTATNDGVLPVTGFTLTDPLVTGLTWVSTTTTSTGLTCAASAPVSCTYAGTLLAGQSVVATVTTTVTSSFTGTSVLNVATATMRGDSDNSNDSATALVAVTQPKDLALTKTAAPSPVSAGGTVTYTLTATNAGVLPVTSFTLSDALGAGLTWVSTSTSSPGLTCAAGSPVSCAFSGSLTSGQSAVVTVVATVPASYAGATVRNAATATTPGDGNPANDTAAVTTDVVRPDLAITKGAPSTATSGSTGSYVLTVTNTGAGAAAGPTTVTDPVPAGAVPTAASGAGWTCTLAAGTVSCSLPGGLAASTAAAPITVDVVWGAPGTVVNTATVPPASGETDLSDNSATASTTVDPAPVPDLSLVKSGPATAAPGDTLTWTLTVANNGTAPATGVLVTDPLAAGLTLVSASGSGWTCAGTTVSCTLGAPLAVGATSVITVSAVLDSTFAGAVVANTAVVGPSDATPADNTDTHVTDVEGVEPAPADLALTKTGPADAVEPGDTITWTIEVTNTGGSPIAGFTVTDPLADGLEVETVTGDGFTCDALPTVSCVHAAALAPGDSVTLVVTSVLPITWEDDTVVNTATAGPADATDDNSDTATTDVVFPITGGGGGPVVSPPVSGGGGGLPTTGAELLRTLGLAGLLVLLGLVLSLAGRRRTA